MASPYMVGNVIDGKAVANQIRKEISAAVARMQERHGTVRCSRGPPDRAGLRAPSASIHVLRRTGTAHLHRPPGWRW